MKSVKGGEEEEGVKKELEKARKVNEELRKKEAEIEKKERVRDAERSKETVGTKMGERGAEGRARSWYVAYCSQICSFCGSKTVRISFSFIPPTFVFTVPPF